MPPNLGQPGQGGAQEPKVHVAFDNGTNTVMVSGPPNKTEQAKRALEKWDVQKPGQAPIPTGPLESKTYRAPSGNADALVKSLKEFYKPGSDVGIAAVGKDAVMVSAYPADHAEIKKFIDSSKDELVTKQIVLNTLTPKQAVESLGVLFESKNNAPVPIITANPNENAIIVRGTPEQIKAVEVALESYGEKPKPLEVGVCHPRQIEVTPSQEFVGSLSGPQGDPIGITFRREMDQRSFLRFERLWRQQQDLKGTAMPLYVGLSGEDGFPHQGTLVVINVMATGEVQGHGTMPKPDRRLSPGMIARVQMRFGPPQKAFKVPDELVRNEAGFHYVLVVNDKDIVERRAVTLGAQVFGGAIIEKGLDAADWTVVSGNLNLAPGTHVRRRIVDERAALQERLAMLRENASAKDKLFREGRGRITLEELNHAKLSVLNAELEFAESDKERIGILEKIVALSREVEEAYQDSRASRAVLLDARDRRLRAEIALEQAKAHATAAPASAERAALQERLATLKENAGGKEKLFQVGRITIQDFDEAKLLVLNAELDLAESDKARIGILEKIVALSREVEEAIDRLYQLGRVTRPELLDVKDKRLKAEIALERAKTQATTQSK